MKKFSVENLGEKTTPEEMKERLLEMLCFFDKFCEENNLTYYLSGGTLLGAIRHKGFIPWDDDIDVNMPRPDCERLMELASQGKLDRYVLLEPNYTDYRHAYHWKLYDCSILVRKNNKGAPYPIFMDIFPIEGLPDTETGNEKHFRIIGRWKVLARALFRKKKFYGKEWYKKLYHGMIAAIASCYGKEKLFNHVVKIMKSIPYETSEYIGVMATNVHTTEERVRKEEYTPVIKVSFEGKMFSAPAGYDTYLRQLYGDKYMELPPVEMRVSHNLVPYYAAEKGACKIAICGLIKSQNLGEQFISKSLEYLIEKALREKGYEGKIEYVEVDILGRCDETYNIKGYYKDLLVNYYGFRVKGLFGTALYHKLERIAKKRKSMFSKNQIYRLRHFIYKHGVNYEKRLYKYYSNKMKNSDFIVVDGAGLLEYSYNEYQEPLRLISEYAEKNDLQVVYNAIGRAGAYDEKDFRSSILRKALRSEVVKYVSARDSVETVQQCAGENMPVKLLADAAFWLKEAFELSVPEKRKKVGIGIVRGNSLKGYGVDFGTENWVQLFSGIAGLLEKKGYEYEFFTNGLEVDMKLGRKILSSMGLSQEYLVERPDNAEVLCDMINNYCGIITCRMHSSIAAFTMGVPSVILSWNDKVEKLMSIIGYEERAVKYEQFDAEYIVELFERALEEGVSEDKIEAMKAKAKESVNDYIDIIYFEIKRKENGYFRLD